MEESFYVDDLISGESSVEDAYLFYTKARERMEEGGFRLRKWVTNDDKLREMIAESEVVPKCSDSCRIDEESYAKASIGTQISLTGEKVLGVAWNFEEDKLVFALTTVAEKATKLTSTKRNVLSLVASIFDPLGIISPVIVCLKILF